jgi:protein-disulfide isomerase
MLGADAFAIGRWLHLQEDCLVAGRCGGYAHSMTRLQLLSLFALILFGASVSYLLKDARPLGRAVEGSELAAHVLRDLEAPHAVYGDGGLTVVIFIDYQCSACRRGNIALRRAIARDGNLRVVYRDWPIFGERSERAARVALAAQRQGIYPLVHEELMAANALDEAALARAVRRAGGSWQQLEADLHAYEHAIAGQLAANARDAYALGLRGTPGYLVGPLLIEGAMTEREFVRAFNQGRSRG